MARRIPACGVSGKVDSSLSSTDAFNTSALHIIYSVFIQLLAPERVKSGSGLRKRREPIRGGSLRASMRVCFPLSLCRNEAMVLLPKTAVFRQTIAFVVNLTAVLSLPVNSLTQGT